MKRPQCFRSVHLCHETNGECTRNAWWEKDRCEINRGQAQSDEKSDEDGYSLDMWTTERGWYSSYPTSGSLLRRNEHDNPGQAEPRLWEKFRWKMRRCALPTGGVAVRLRARSARFPEIRHRFQCFPRWGCEGASWVQGRCRTRRPWTSLAAIFLFYVYPLASRSSSHLPSSIFPSLFFLFLSLYYYIYI